VTREQLRAFRDKQGWSQSQLAELLNASLDRKYTSGTISQWELGKRGVPDHVGAFITSLKLEEAFPSEPRPVEGEYEPEDPAAEEGREDTMPPPPPDAGTRTGAVAALPGGNTVYSRVCEELFEMIATGVGLIGAATGSEVLKRDGEILNEDKAKLGRAYGKLAETNATFRNMIASATGGGAWLEVCLVSGLTAGKIMRSHQSLRQPRFTPEPTPEDEPGVMYGDGGVINFPQQAG